MCVSFGLLHVKCISDFPASTLVCVLANSIFGSPLNLICRDSDPCLCLTLISACSLINPFFHSHFPVHLGPSPHIPITIRNKLLFKVYMELQENGLNKWQFQ